jgi:alpha-glucosidase (family GH31 glycosyl hydrolase)
LVNGFQSHNVPLDVLVIGMDWHPTSGVKWWENKSDQSGHPLGWTGYTWSPLYFPDPTRFLSWVHQQGLKATLNMHPASGVQPFEQKYPEMARAMGIDPATNQYVKFDIADKKFATNYMNILHHPLEKQGVDFFWLDWQQEPDTSIAGLNNTWWLNYVHFTDMEREGKRPLLFHRWGGLGNHRYQIGFSGDTISVWESLAFQPYFTATAANVGYGFWSHDIGGHMPGKVSPELYTRWIQFGVFSPILRTHTTKNPESERRIWAYPEPYADIMRTAYATRYAFLPYIYTAARQAYDIGISMLRPMYYDYAESPEAYDFKDQYMFGDSLLVAPITAPISADSDLATKPIWLPPGEWIEVYTGARLKGPTKLERRFALDEIPLYAKAGVLIPEQPAMMHTGEKPVDPLILEVFPGANGSTRIYDDAGNALGYKKNESTWTEVHQTRTGNSVKIDIMPVIGSYPGMPTQRAYEVHLAEAWPPQSLTVNGRPAKWTYNGDYTIVTIRTERFPVTQKVEIVIDTSPELVRQEALLSGLRGLIARLRHAMALSERTWPNGWAPDAILDALQTGNRISLNPQSALQQVQNLHAASPEITRQLQTLLSNLDSGHAKFDDLVGVGTTMQQQREAVKRALAHIAE